MTEQDRAVLIELLYQLADDELIIGHRDSEWLGLAPHIEADIAFASIAQDEVGHAVTYLRLLEELGEGQADDLAYLRAAEQRRNAVLLERPNGKGTYLQNPEFEWGYAIVRRLAYDLFDTARLDVITRSSYEPLAQVAAKIQREEQYHILHHGTWWKRLATGTPESRRHLEAGIEKTWIDVGGLFRFGTVAGSSIFPATSQELAARWSELFERYFTEVDLPWPNLVSVASSEGLDGRRGEHTPDLADLLNTMGEVYRTAPGAAW